MRRPHPETPCQEPSPVPRLAYSIDEAAQSCGLSRSKLYELMQSQELHFAKCGARRLILAKDLEAFLDRLRGAA